MVGNSNDPHAFPVIDDAFHDEVLRGLEREDVPTGVRSRLPGVLGTGADTGSSRLKNACLQGNGVPAHVDFIQAFMRKQQCLARRIVVATTVDAPESWWICVRATRH